MAYGQIAGSFGRLTGIKINPSNPEEVRRMRQNVEKESDGRTSIKTVDELEGSGLDPRGIDPNGLGYTLVENEQKKRENDPNSWQFKQRSIFAKQAAEDERMQRYNKMMLRGGPYIKK